MLAPPHAEPRTLDDRPEPPKPIIDNNPFKDDPMQPPPPPVGLRTFKKPVHTASRADANGELYSLNPDSLSKGVSPASYQPSVRLARPLKAGAIPKNPLR